MIGEFTCFKETLQKEGLSIKAYLEGVSKVLFEQRFLWRSEYRANFVASETIMHLLCASDQTESEWTPITTPDG